MIGRRLQATLSTALLILSVVVPLVNTETAQATPDITVTSPTAGQVVAEGALTITGTTPTDDEIAVTVDGQAVGIATLGNDGTWSYTVPHVSAGAHVIEAQRQQRNQYGFLANRFTDNIDVVDVDQHILVAQITNAQSVGTRYDPIHNIIYSASNADGDCRIRGYDPLTYEIVVDVSPLIACVAISMTLSTDGNTGWLLYEDGAGGGTYAVMEANLQTQTSINQVPLSQLSGHTPSGISLRPDESEFWVRIDTGIEVFFTADHSHKWEIWLDPDSTADRQNIVFSHDGATAYTADATTGNVFRIDVQSTAPDTVVAAVGVNMVAVSPDGTRLYVTASAPTSKLFVIKLADNTIEESGDIDPSYPPESIAFAPDGKWVVGDDHGSGGIFFGSFSTGSTVADTMFVPGGGSYFTSTDQFVTPQLTSVLGESTSVAVTAVTPKLAGLSVPNTGLGRTKAHN